MEIKKRIKIKTDSLEEKRFHPKYCNSTHCGTTLLDVINSLFYEKLVLPSQSLSPESEKSKQEKKCPLHVCKHSVESGTLEVLLAF